MNEDYNKGIDDCIEVVLGQQKSLPTLSSDYALCNLIVHLLKQRKKPTETKSLFDPAKDLKVSKEKGEKVISDGTLLGTSDAVKDCYWACHQLGDEYFISINGSSSMWAVS